LAVPWSWSTASCAAGPLTQLPCRAAQAGTTTGLGWTLGDGEGLGVGLSIGLGVGLGDVEGACRFADGLV